MFLTSFFSLLAKIFFFTGRLKINNVFDKPMTIEEEKECFEKLKNGDKTAEEKLIKHNLRLVAHIVKKYKFAKIEQDELISVGSIGLMKAIKSYNTEKGNSFSTYASRCIQNEILMMVRSQRKFINEVSLEDKVKTDKDGNEVSLIDVLEDTNEHVQDKAEIQIIYQKIVDIINNNLNKREKEIIYLRYGINGGIPKTQNEVAKELNISRSYISRIEKKALKEIREQSDGLVNTYWHFIYKVIKYYRKVSQMIAPE